MRLAQRPWAAMMSCPGLDNKKSTNSAAACGCGAPAAMEMVVGVLTGTKGSEKTKSTGALAFFSWSTSSGKASTTMGNSPASGVAIYFRFDSDFEHCSSTFFPHVLSFRPLRHAQGKLREKSIRFLAFARDEGFGSPPSNLCVSVRSFFLQSHVPPQTHL
jgi:hypothetical protein